MTTTTMTAGRSVAAVPNLLLLLLAFSCGTYIVEAQVVIEPIAQITDRCTNVQTPVMGCNSADMGLYSFAVMYPDVVAGGEDVSLWDGAMECGMPLTLEQSAKEPTLSRVQFSPGSVTNEVDEEYYTLLLVDTADSPFHPILHYGASNVQFDGTNNLVLSDLSPFSDYRGPSPPAGVPGTQNLLANYEWIVAKQASGKIMEQELPSPSNFGQDNVKFDYEGYLSEELGVNADIVFTTYFQSGFCVDPIVIGDEMEEETASSASSSSSAANGRFNKLVATVTSALLLFILPTVIHN